MKVKDVLVEGLLDEAFSPHQLATIEQWVTEAFRTYGMNFEFSPHFKIRSDQRGDELTTEDIGKIFATMLVNGDIKKAFEKLSKNTDVSQKSRIIDFYLNGNIGSIQINKEKNGIVAETFYYGERLSQGGRGNFTQNMRTAGKIPSYDMGKIPDETLLDIIRKTNEPNLTDGSNKNIHGYDNMMKLAHQRASTIFNTVSTYATMLVDDFRKLLLDGKNQNDITKAWGSMIKGLDGLQQAGIVGLSDRAKAGLNNLHRSLNSGTQIDKPAVYRSLEPIIADIDRSIGTTKNSFDEARKKIKPFTEPYGDSVTKYINSGKVDQSVIPQVKILNTIGERYSSFIKNSNILKSSAITGKDKNNYDELGNKNDYTINKYSGLLGRQNRTDRNRLTTQSRRSYGGNLSGMVNTRAIDYLDTVAQNLLTTKTSDDSNERELRELLGDALKYRAAKNIPEFLDSIELVLQSIEGQSTTFKQKLKSNGKILNTAIANARQQLNQNLEEEKMSLDKSKLKQFVRTLLRDFANPDRPSYDEYSGEWDDNQESYNKPLDDVPREYQNEVLKLTFSAIISHLKKNPEFVEVIESNGPEISWLPKGIYHKLVSIGKELDEIHADMSNKANAEKPKYNKVDEASKYFGSTTKVKINKKGWQVPLNKRGFGV